MDAVGWLGREVWRQHMRDVRHQPHVITGRFCTAHSGNRERCGFAAIAASGPASAHLEARFLLWQSTELAYAPVEIRNRNCQVGFSEVRP